MAVPTLTNANFRLHEKTLEQKLTPRKKPLEKLQNFLKPTNIKSANSSTIHVFYSYDYLKKIGALSSVIIKYQSIGDLVNLRINPRKCDSK